MHLLYVYHAQDFDLEFIKNFTINAVKQNKHTRKLYGLDIFWQLMQDSVEVEVEVDVDIDGGDSAGSRSVNAGAEKSDAIVDAGASLCEAKRTDTETKTGVEANVGKCDNDSSIGTDGDKKEKEQKEPIKNNNGTSGMIPIKDSESRKMTTVKETVTKDLFKLVSDDVSDHAHIILKDCLSKFQFRNQRNLYLAKCLDGLTQGRSVVQCLALSESIIGMVPTYHGTRSKTISDMEDTHRVIDKIIDDTKRYVHCGTPVVSYRYIYTCK